MAKHWTNHLAIWSRCLPPSHPTPSRTLNPYASMWMKKAFRAEEGRRRKHPRLESHPFSFARLKLCLFVTREWRTLTYRYLQRETVCPCLMFYLLSAFLYSSAVNAYISVFVFVSGCYLGITKRRKYITRNWGRCGGLVVRCSRYFQHCNRIPIGMTKTKGSRSVSLFLFSSN